MTEKLIPNPIGIDLGTFTSKIAVAKRGGVEIITNEANFRQTPTIVGYGKSQRNIGQSGNIKMKSNFRDTVPSVMRYLGLSGDYPMLRMETKHCSARNSINNNRLQFEINYQGQKQTLVAEQIAAAYFNKLKQIISKNGFDNKQAVIAVPAYLTQQQRVAYINAAKIAEFNVTRLLNSSTAISLDYCMFRKSQLTNENPRHVLFVDFGHGKFDSFVSAFTKQQMTIIQQNSARNLGCRDIDYHLYEFYRKVFQKSSNGCDIAQNRKAIVKIMEAIERQRKTLSGIYQHQMNIEYLMDQCDLNYTMKREEFEKISQPIFNAIGNILIQIRQTLKTKNIQLHSIQLLGGGTRIPFVIQLIKDIFSMQPSRTLNSSESVARGCALMAAIKSPLFRVPEEKMNQRVNYGVKLCWNFVHGNQYLGLNSQLYPQKQKKLIFEQGSKVPTSKTIKFTRKQAIQILVEYEPTVNGFNKHIGYFVTKPQNPKQESFGVSFKLKYTQNGLVTFEQCNLIEQWQQQTKIPKKKTEKKEQKKQQKKEGQPEKMELQKPQQQEFEIKQTKKQKYTQVKYDANNFDRLTEKDIHSYFTIESTMMNQDHIIVDTYERKNQLESLIYNWKERLNGSHSQYIIKNEIPPILVLLDQISNWLYSEGENANRGTYLNKIQSIRAKVDPIQKRYDNIQRIKAQLVNLMSTLKQSFEFINTLDKKYQHITPEERSPVLNHIERIRAWIKHSEEQQALKKKWEDPVISVSDIQKNIREITDKTKQVMYKPAPKPQKPASQQKPTGDKKANQNEQSQTKTNGEKMEEEEDVNKNPSS